MLSTHCKFVTLPNNHNSHIFTVWTHLTAQWALSIIQRIKKFVDLLSLYSESWVSVCKIKKMNLCNDVTILGLFDLIQKELHYDIIMFFPQRL